MLRQPINHSQMSTVSLKQIVVGTMNYDSFIVYSKVLTLYIYIQYVAIDGPIYGNIHSILYI